MSAPIPNIFEEILKELPKGKITITAKDKNEQHIADQMTAIVNYMRENERPNP